MPAFTRLKSLPVIFGLTRKKLKLHASKMFYEFTLGLRDYIELSHRILTPP